MTTVNTPSLPAMLADLVRRAPPLGRVLSVYLDTSPERAARDAFLMAYIDGVKALRASVPPDDADRFEAAAAQAERYLRDEFRRGPPGVAVFASGHPGYFYAAPLPVAPVEDLAWDERAEIAPLHALLDELERLTVALVDKKRARITTLRFGAIEHRRELEDDVPGKQATGGWYSLAQARIARHHEDHVLRHIKRTVAALLEELRARPFDRLLLGGPPEAVALLRHHLPPPLKLRLAGDIHLPLFAGDEEIVRAALGAAARAEREAELAAVEGLIGARGGVRVALGLDATLAALNDRRVERMLLLNDFAHAGGHCPSCDRLVLSADRCPLCHGSVRPLDNLRESIVRTALGQGAVVEVVGGPAAERLAAEGGVGAWVRRA
jgi:peptide subunit release factor 1 (eRF1)